MKIDKQFIDVKIDDPGKGSDVCLLVDKPDFRKKIISLRRKYQKYIDYSIIDPESRYVDFDIKRREDGKLEKMFGRDVEKIRREFHRPLPFKRVIEQAIITGVVDDKDYSSAYLEEKELYPPKYHTMEWPEDIKYSIVISPVTKKPDVDRVFMEFQKRVKNSYSKKNWGQIVKRWYGFAPEPRIYIDTRESIGQIREWYIKRESGISTLSIALEDIKSSLKEYKTKLEESEKSQRSDEKFYSITRYLTKVETSKRKIKTQLRRYRRLLKAY